MTQGDLPQEVKRLLGSEIDLGWGADDVCKALIRHWVEALEDANPVYVDDGYAKRTQYGGIIAPATMVGAFAKPAVWPRASYETDVTRRIPLNIPEAAVQKVEWEFVKEIRLGDRIGCRHRLVDVSPLKTTRLGPGHFVTTERVFRNQDGELVARLSITAFRYARDRAEK